MRPGSLALFVRASAAAVPPEGEQRSGFVQKLQKSIRDFGFGKRSLVEGGVGIFVFTGIGADWVVAEPAYAQLWGAG